MNNWDVVVIGAGQTGSPLAARLAEAGRRVLLIERKYLGGTCVNYGCTPTKTMVASARAAHVARNAARLGVHVRDVRVDLGAVVDRKERLVQQWRSGVQKRLERAGSNVSVLRGHARLVAARTAEVNGQRHGAETVVIDVGTRPTVPEIPGLDRISWLDNGSIMKLRTLPEHLIVLGGGYIGCEFAQMFRRFGSPVTIIDYNQHLLARADEEISTALEEVFRQEDIELFLGQTVTEARSSGSNVTIRLASGTEISGSHLLVAAGRTPNTQDLGCEEAGIDLDEHGFIIVDDHYRTNVQSVYAAGDVTGGPQFTHTAWDDHRRLYDILLERRAWVRTQRIVPHTTFTDPQVAGVGLTERQARERGLAYEVATFPFGNIARAIETDETAGIMKVLLDAESERILGAAVVGAEAGELIHILLALMLADAPAGALVDGQFVHPAFAEGVQSLLMRLPRYVLR